MNNFLIYLYILFLVQPQRHVLETVQWKMTAEGQRLGGVTKARMAQLYIKTTHQFLAPQA